MRANEQQPVQRKRTARARPCAEGPTQDARQAPRAGRGTGKCSGERLSGHPPSIGSRKWRKEREERVDRAGGEQ